MEPQFSQTLPPHSIGFILQDRDAKLGNHGPKIHLVERFCVMKSEPCRILKGRTGCIESFSVHADIRGRRRSRVERWRLASMTVR